MKQRIALFLACILCLACLVPAMAEEDGEETDTQEQYWIDSGREALWTALNAEDGEGVPLTEEETAAFLSESVISNSEEPSQDQCTGAASGL